MTDKEEFKAELDRVKEETGIGLSEWENGVEHGRMEVINALYKKLDSMQEEPKECMYSKGNYTDEDRKALCDGCKEECKFNKKEESVSEDLEQEINEYISILTERRGDFPKLTKLGFRTIARHFAAWQKQKDESKVLTEEQCRKIRDDAFELGKDAMKQQMMAKAVDATVHIDAGGYPYIPQIELYDYDKDIPLAKEGDKYKVVLIKEV